MGSGLGLEAMWPGLLCPCLCLTCGTSIGVAVEEQDTEVSVLTYVAQPDSIS